MARVALVLLVATCLLAPALCQTATSSFPISPVLTEDLIPDSVDPLKIQSNLTLFLTLYGKGYQTYLCNNQSLWTQQSPYHQLFVMSSSCNGPWAAVVGACSTGGPVGQFYTVPLPGRLGAALEIFNPLTVLSSVRVNISAGEDNLDAYGIESEEWNLQRVTGFTGGSTQNVPQVSPQAAINLASTAPALPTGLSSPNLPDITQAKYWMRGFPQGGASPPFSCLENQRVDVPVTSYFLFWK